MTYLLAKSAPTIPALPSGCSLAFSTAYTLKPATSAPSGRRQYLFHGLNNSASYWDSEPFLTFCNTLRAAGDELVLFNLPIAATCFFTNGGWQYREQFNACINAVMNAVEATGGPAAKNIVGGISYGGLHSMMAVSSNGRFMAWWAHLPVTRVDALTELAGVGDAARFNPQFAIGELSVKPGRLSWGTADTRVNGLLTKAIADQLPTSIIKVEYVGLDHTTTPAGAAEIAAWTAAI